MKFSYRAVTAGFAVLLSAGALVAGSATASAQEPGTGASPEAGTSLACPDHRWSNHDGRTGRFFKSNSVNIRTGPSTGCTSLGHGQKSHRVRLNCWKHGVGGTWSHVQDLTTGVRGWVKNSLLVGGGANKRC
ncbi:hypothetical protein BC739_006898 [Kutzneria viridogrisea]|uniref:SH3b domain-containing protein n=2 Tax=Kutzneria TaxID=43356 RepID=W5WM00_9PSEU|nr:SH3 domain-containing protein [Kutzneria albida]AHI01898.1 hypothetical protein KALB_8541 [Kutzneria albida DSM 43870]MBA8929680.1 hypothetical protein [Kutzneria viridogrisea]